MNRYAHICMTMHNPVVLSASDEVRGNLKQTGQGWRW
jgi:hypothetical protein